MSEFEKWLRKRLEGLNTETSPYDEGQYDLINEILEDHLKGWLKNRHDSWHKETLKSGCEHKWMLIQDETAETIAICLKCEKEAKVKFHLKCEKEAKL